jgi:hypothetical protein
MGKRQKRFYGYKIKENILTLLNIELNLILKSKVTFHGKIIEIEDNQIIFIDGLKRKCSFLIDDIEELIVDFKSNF